MKACWRIGRKAVVGWGSESLDAKSYTGPKKISRKIMRFKRDDAE